MLPRGLGSSLNCLGHGRPVIVARSAQAFPSLRSSLSTQSPKGPNGGGDSAGKPPQGRGRGAANPAMANLLDTFGFRDILERAAQPAKGVKDSKIKPTTSTSTPTQPSETPSGAVVSNKPTNETPAAKATFQPLLGPSFGRGRARFAAADPVSNEKSFRQRQAGRGKEVPRTTPPAPAGAAPAAPTVGPVTEISLGELADEDDVDAFSDDEGASRRRRRSAAESDEESDDEYVAADDDDISDDEEGFIIPDAKEDLTHLYDSRERLNIYSRKDLYAVLPEKPDRTILQYYNEKITDKPLDPKLVQQWRINPRGGGVKKYEWPKLIDPHGTFADVHEDDADLRLGADFSKHIDDARVAKVDPIVKDSLQRVGNQLAKMWQYAPGTKETMMTQLKSSLLGYYENPNGFQPYVVKAAKKGGEAKGKKAAAAAPAAASKGGAKPAAGKPAAKAAAKPAAAAPAGDKGAAKKAK